MIALKDVANVEFKMPRYMINQDGNGITQEFIKYVAPLIADDKYDHM